LWIVINLFCAKLIIDFLDGANDTNEYICKISIPNNKYFKHNELYKQDKYNYFFEYIDGQKKLETGNKYYLSACRYENGISTKYKKNKNYILCFPPEKLQYVFEIWVDDIVCNVDEHKAKLREPLIWKSITATNSKRKQSFAHPEIYGNGISLCIEENQLFVGKSLPRVKIYYAKINEHVEFKDSVVLCSDNCWYINNSLIPIDITNNIIILNSKKKYKLDGITLRFL